MNNPIDRGAIITADKLESAAKELQDEVTASGGRDFVSDWFADLPSLLRDAALRLRGFDAIVRADAIKIAELEKRLDDLTPAGG